MVARVFSELGFFLLLLKFYLRKPKRIVLENGRIKLAKHDVDHSVGGTAEIR